MEPSIKDQNTMPGNKKKRPKNSERLNRDLQRWQRKRATIGKYTQEKLGSSVVDRSIELDIYKTKR
jgi:hypothetical protein